MYEYDKIADRYDGLFTGEDSLAENREVAGMVALRKDEAVFDIGCGTGLFVEIADIAPQRYIGIDPSRKMLEQFGRKHPAFKGSLVNDYFNKDTLMPYVEVIVSLFGAASYLPESALRKIAERKARLFLMFYKPDYFPVTYAKCGVNFKHEAYTRENLETIFGQGTAREYHNYLIIERQN